jgi:galactokinase/mevalonate kinase-like predicted kinase
MVRATPFPSRAAEATAACRLDLAGGTLSSSPAAALPAGALSVAVAVDRRAFARVEAGTSGIEIETKDTLLKAAVPNVSSLSNDGVVGLVRRVLVGLDVETGLRVVTQARVPFEVGLASAGALAIAVAAAATRATGRELSAEALAAFARHADEGPGEDHMEPAGALASVLGAVTCAPFVPGTGARLRADPARVEECLILVDPASGPVGRPRSAGEGRAAEENTTTEEGMHGTVSSGPPGRVAEIADLAGRARGALEAGRYAELADILSAEQRLREELVPVEIRDRVRPIVAIAEAAGGGARLCGGGRGSLVLVWAEPGARSSGPREAAIRGLKAAGYRLFPCRVDLRGLEVEDA